MGRSYGAPRQKVQIIQSTSWSPTCHRRNQPTLVRTIRYLPTESPVSNFLKFDPQASLSLKKFQNTVGFEGVWLHSPIDSTFDRGGIGMVSTEAMDLRVTMPSISMNVLPKIEKQLPGVWKTCRHGQFQMVFVKCSLSVSYSLIRSFRTVSIGPIKRSKVSLPMLSIQASVLAMQSACLFCFEIRATSPKNPPLSIVLTNCLVP